ncbi:hypothetical protein NEOKW01_0090 [Nematocida sp. AWRm80]|nr:hypothetical protein NEOKW01_0090 [Nematocida sp. AWRm80]
MAIRKTAQKKTPQETKVVEEEKIENVEDEEKTASSQSLEEESASDSVSESATETDSEESASESDSKSEEQESSEESESKSVEAETTEQTEVAPEETKDERTVFIKGIKYETTGEDLQELFGKFGTIKEIRIPKSRDTDKGKGFAYIEFENKESCKEALSLSGTECDGRRLVVDFAKPPVKSDEYNARERQPRQQNNEDGVTVFLGNVPFEFDKDEFFDYLCTFASVRDLRVPTDRETGRPKGFAFASFENFSEANKLINSDLRFHDRQIRAQISEQKRIQNRREGSNNYGKSNWSSENTHNKKHVRFE